MRASTASSSNSNSNCVSGSKACLAGPEVKEQNTDAKRFALGGLGLCATKDGPDAREQLAWLEGLADVVVGIELEPDGAGDVVARTGVHEDRRPLHGGVGAHVLAPLEVVLARQHQVDQQRTEGPGLERAQTFSPSNRRTKSSSLLPRYSVTSRVRRRVTGSPSRCRPGR